MSSSQKFIARNRAPRVQIEYDVELYGAQKKVQLPFVMGVMSDLAGKSEVPQPAIADRKFLEIDVDNFDERMKSMAPRAAFTVPNTLTGEGNLAVDLTFNKMSDFSPEAIAANVDALKPLLDARTQLSNLMTYMDGKAGAEALIEEILGKPELLQSLTNGVGSAAANTDAALDGLRAAAPADAPEKDEAADVLAGIERVEAPEEKDESADVLAGIERVEDTPEEDITGDVLAGIERTADAPEQDTTGDVLASIERTEDAPERDTTADVLAGIEAVEETSEVDNTADILASIEQVEDTPEEDNTADILAGIEQVEETPEADTTADVLAGIEHVEDAPEEDNTADVLAGIEQVEVPTEEDITDNVLAGIEQVEDTPEVDTTADVLASIEAVEDTPEKDSTADVLAGIEQIEDAPEEDTTSDVLASIEAIEEAPEEDTTADILAGIEQVEDAPEEDTTADVLANIEEIEDIPEEDTTADVLAGIEQVEDASEEDTTADVLAGIEQIDDSPEESNSADDILAGLDAPEPEATDETSIDDVLGGIEATPEVEDDDGLDEILSSIDTTEPETDDAEDVADVLAGIEAAPETAEETDDLDDILGGLDAPEVEAEDDADDILAGIEAPPDETTETDDLDDILGGLDAPAEDAEAKDDTDDILAGLDAAPDVEDRTDDLDEILGGLDATEDVETEDDTDDILAGLDAAPEAEEETDDLDDILGGLDALEPQKDGGDDLDDILSGIDTAAPETDGADDLDNILDGLDATEPEAAADDDLDDILSGLGTDDAEPEADTADDDMDALLAGLSDDVPEVEAADDTDDILAGLEADEPEADGADDDMDALLAGLGDDTSEAETADDADDVIAGLNADEPEADIADDDMDALLASLDTPDEAEDDGLDDLDALLGSLDDDTQADADSADDDLDSLLGDLGIDDDSATEADSGAEGEDMADAEEPSAPAQSPFGKITATRPNRDDLNRTKFRMAVFGDFTGRASRGAMDTGDALAARKPIPLDVDTIDEIIEGFGTTLVLPIGEGGTGVEVKLGEMDDLHPDELYDNVELFDAISGVRQQLGVGSMADKAVEKLKTWSETYATPIKLPKRSAGSSMPTNLKLTDFQALIGDTRGTLTQAGPADALIAQIIGPHVVKAPDAGAEAMKTAVDEALSSAMNLILHHPEFQAIEAQWRSLDLLARRIETDVKLEIVLYDISAEELAADLAAREDLAESGLFKLVTDVTDPEEGAGGFSALFGLYTFEETPPHAELLARIGQVAAHVDAPFFSAMSPNYLDTAPEDRHPLVAKNWDTLRKLPEAAYVALASPRFLLRQPYGAKSDPVYAFNFEEFSPKEGLKGMLWANPVILVAILLAGTYKKDGKAMDLGSMMALGDLPFFYVNDRYGDQVALPCTERNLTSDPAQATLGRGYMPVLWIKGRNEIRLGSFRSLGGNTIAGPWEANVPAPRKQPGAPTLEAKIPAPDGGADSGDDDTSLDDLLAGLEDDASTGGDDDDISLDDLLAGFDDDGDSSDDDDDMDPDLAALLEGL